jgi:hypothetical protein
MVAQRESHGETVDTDLKTQLARHQSVFWLIVGFVTKTVLEGAMRNLENCFSWRKRQQRRRILSKVGQATVILAS